MFTHTENVNLTIAAMKAYNDGPRVDDSFAETWFAIKAYEVNDPNCIESIRSEIEFLNGESYTKEWDANPCEYDPGMDPANNYSDDDSE